MSNELLNSSDSTINSQISYVSDQIFSEILTFIKTNTSNLNNSLQKLISIYKYIKKTLSNDEEEKVYPSVDNFYGKYNSSFSPSNTYLVNKLKRKLKAEKQENKLRELSYLEKLCSLRNEIKFIESETETNIKKNKRNENSDIFCSPNSDKKKCYSLSSLKKKSNLKKNGKKIGNGFKVSNSLDIYPTVNNLKIDEKSKVGNNICDYGFEISGEEMSNYHTKTINHFLDKYRIKMYCKNNKRIKNINYLQKHDFHEIKKSVQDGKNKIRLIKDSISPVLFSLRYMKTGKL